MSSNDARVFGLGLGRTGTGSMREALNKLGYKTLHMSEHPKDLPHFGRAWPAIYKKVDAGKVTRADWEVLLKGHTATMDFPTCLFPRELLAAYPDAKFIITVRDPERWYESTINTIGQSAAFPWWQLSWLLRPRTRPIKAISSRIWGGFFRGQISNKEVAIQAYKDHEALVRATIPSNQLLVFDVKKHGWKELCEFLGKDTPEEPFPHENEGGNMAAQYEVYNKQLLKEFTTYTLSGIGVVGIAALAIFQRRKVASIVGRWLGRF